MSLLLGAFLGNSLRTEGRNSGEQEDVFLLAHMAGLQSISAWCRPSLGFYQGALPKARRVFCRGKAEGSPVPTLPPVPSNTKPITCHCDTNIIKSSRA